MLVSSYVNGFGNSFGQSAAPSMLQLIEMAQARGRGAGFSGYGFGAPASDYLAFDNNQASPATFVGGTGAANIVFCNKEARTFRTQCVLNKTGDAARAPIRAMQQAIDRVIDLIPSNKLAGRTLKGQMPQGDGTTALTTFPVPGNITSPIAHTGGGGIDGIVGVTTTKFGVLALTLAGMLKAFPNPGISAAFVAPTRNDVWAEFSTEIAGYLNDVANNFKALLDAFTARDNQPVQTQLDVKTIPFVVPLAAQKSSKGAIITAAAAMIGITTIAAISAAKHKPGMMYDMPAPALGRGRRRGRHARPHLRPRGW